MKTTLEERLAAASANMKLTARKAFKHPITSILSLCVVAGIAATIASFSQTSEPTVAAAAVTAPEVQTLPVKHMLTSKDGRTIDVTILSKSDTAIKATRADGKEFEITLDKLSDTDKAFIAGLIVPDPNVVKKPTVLMVVTSTVGIKTQNMVTWLESCGFEVTFGRLCKNEQEKKWWEKNIETHNKDPKNPNKSIVLDPLKRMDAYDIVWIEDFHASDNKDGPSHFDIASYRINNLNPIAIGIGVATAKAKFVKSYDNFLSRPPTHTSDMENFVSAENNVIFYDTTQPSRSKKSISKEETLTKLRTTVNGMLTQ